MGRIGLYGVDVHNSVQAQLDGASQCLCCLHDKVTAEHWQTFVAAMQQYHDVDLSNCKMPEWIKN